MSFEGMATSLKIPILNIEKNGRIIARGIHIAEAISIFKDNGILTVSYPDTGVFILFKDSHIASTNEKIKQYLNGFNTTREIVFQSRDAAAKFVLGESGRTNDWKI